MSPLPHRPTQVFLFLRVLLQYHTTGTQQQVEVGGALRVKSDCTKFTSSSTPLNPPSYIYNSSTQLPSSSSPPTLKHPPGIKLTAVHVEKGKDNSESVLIKEIFQLHSSCTVAKEGEESTVWTCSETLKTISESEINSEELTSYQENSRMDGEEKNTAVPSMDVIELKNLDYKKKESSSDDICCEDVKKEVANDPCLVLRIAPESMMEVEERIIILGEREVNQQVMKCSSVLSHVSSRIKAFVRWTRGETERQDVESSDAKTSGRFRRGKIMRTVCAQAAYLGVTLNLGMIGPSLLDLEILTGSTTQELTTIFTWRAALGLLASLLLGPVLDHVDRFFLLAVALLADVVFIAVAPWMTNTAALLATMAPPEFFNSVIGMGTHLICISIWKEEAGPSLQALNLMATIGYTLSPLICKPFLAHSESTIAFNTSSEIQLNITANTTEGPPPVTNIQFAYLIVALYDLLIAVAVIAVFIHDGCAFRIKSEKKNETEKNEKEEKEKKGKSFMIKICVLFFIFNIFYGGIEVGYAGLLMTFSVKYLGWSKNDGTSVTAVLQASNAIVTAAAVLISKWIKAQVILFISIIVVTAAMIILSLTVHYSNLVLWFCTVCLGVGYATIMPCSYTWVNEVMEVTGKFSSAYWSGFFVGFMAIPAITGHLFENVDPMWLPYMTLICSLGMLILFGVISFVVYREKSKKALVEK